MVLIHKCQYTLFPTGISSCERDPWKWRSHRAPNFGCLCVGFWGRSGQRASCSQAGWNLQKFIPTHSHPFSTICLFGCQQLELLCKWKIHEIWKQACCPVWQESHSDSLLTALLFCLMAFGKSCKLSRLLLGLTFLTVAGPSKIPRKKFWKC